MEESAAKDQSYSNLFRLEMIIIVYYITIGPDENETFIELNHPPIKKGKYFVGNQGSIKNEWGTILRPHTDKDGYLRLELVCEGDVKAKKFYVHRLVAIAYIAGDHSLLVNHKNSIRPDNRVENLEWVTSKENTQHGIEHGYFKTEFTAVERGYNKYSEEFIRSICVLLQQKMTTREMWKHIDISGHDKRSIKTLINDLRKKRSWKWIVDEYDW